LSPSNDAFVDMTLRRCTS